MPAEELFSPRAQRVLDAIDRNRFVLACVVGYGLCRCMSGISLHVAAHGETVLWSDAGKIAGIALMVACSVVPAVASRVRGRFGAYVAPTLCTLAGSMLALGCQLAGAAAPAPATHFALFAVGLGSAAMMLQWLELIGCLSLRSIALVIAGAELLNAALSLGGADGGGLPTGGVLGLATLCSGLLLLCCRRGWELSPAIARMPEVPDGNPRDVSARPGLQRFVSWKLLVWVAFYCFAYGVVTAHLGLSLSSAANDVGGLLPCAAILVAALVAPGHFDVRTLKSTAFAFMVAGLVLAALAPTSGLLLQVCVGAGAASCRLFAYSLACMRARQARVSAIPASSAVKALIIAATSGGLQVGASGLPLGQAGTLGLFVFGAFLMSVFLSPFNIGEESVIEEARRSGRTASQAAKLEALGRELGLSQRETTVFRLMARGLSASEIGEELFITKSAVRAHQSRIYAKLGVHSQREFAEAVGDALSL